MKTVHYSILPSLAPATHGIIIVKWRFFDLIKFDLKTESDQEKFKQYRRPCRMLEPYARQIATKFTAYFSRAGVDEIFIKNSSNCSLFDLLNADFSDLFDKPSPLALPNT